MEEVLYLSFVTASITFFVTETKLGEPLREWMGGKGWFWEKLFSCGYCFGHWIAFLLVAVYRPRFFKFWWLLDFFLTALVIAWFSAFQWAALSWLMVKTGK